MYYYKFNIGDYASHTKHLTPIEDICYRRLLDWYYLHEKPIPLDIKVTSRMISLSECSTSVEQMLIEFFTKTKVGWINRRSDAEIKIYKSKQNSNSKAGTISAIKRKAYIEQMLNGCGTNDEPNNKHKTVNKKQETINNKHTKDTHLEMLLSVGVENEIAKDWLSVRKSKRLPLTKTAFNAISKKIINAGLTINEGIKICVENGWAGFSADWLNGTPELKTKPFVHWWDTKEATHQKAIQEGVEIISDLKQLRKNLNECIQNKQHQQKLAS